MSDPGAVQGNKATGVDSAGKDVLGDEDALIPEENLVATRVCVGYVLALADALKPLVVGVRAVRTFEPFVDEHVCSVVVELLAHELAHGETRGNELGVVSAGHGRGEWGNVGGDVGVAGEAEGVEVVLGVEVHVERRRSQGGH